MNGRPKDLPRGPLPFSTDFAQSTAPYDVDALDLIEGHPKWSGMLRYRHPSTGQTWTVPNMDYTKQRVHRIEALEYDFERYRSIALQHRVRGNHISQYEADRYNLIATRLEVQINILKKEAEHIQKARADYMAPGATDTMASQLNSDHMTSRLASFELYATVIGLQIKAESFEQWICARTNEWAAQNGSHPPRCKDENLAFDAWLKQWAAQAVNVHVTEILLKD